MNSYDCQRKEWWTKTHGGGERELNWSALDSYCLLWENWGQMWTYYLYIRRAKWILRLKNYFSVKLEISCPLLFIVFCAAALADIEPLDSTSPGVCGWSVQAWGGPQNSICLVSEDTRRFNGLSLESSVILQEPLGGVQHLVITHTFPLRLPLGKCKIFFIFGHLAMEDYRKYREEKRSEQRLWIHDAVNDHRGTPGLLQFWQSWDMSLVYNFTVL